MRRSGGSVMQVLNDLERIGRKMDRVVLYLKATGCFLVAGVILFVTAADTNFVEKYSALVSIAIALLIVTGVCYAWRAVRFRS